MEEKKQKNTTKQPLPKEKDTGMPYLDALSKELGSKKVEPPKERW
jgi:hypothetical protein